MYGTFYDSYAAFLNVKIAAMKTLIFTILLIFGFAGQNYCKPVNTIYSMSEPVFTDEVYVNDIPFNTYDIAINAILEDYETRLAEEPYINDIPFDTKKIACQYFLQRMTETSGETNVNDIPFNTEKIINDYHAAQLIEIYRNEKNINDLPGNLDFSVIYPVRREVPIITVRKDDKKKNIIVVPGFSL